ncbi:fatty acid elongase [Thamnocephalis sphaerospora]|uniref:Elongation of fatty acids protein n=1 Tax=Thamnocephalis sphaerospora TaxID=78915 RepID=A0A4P9XWF6_9FUNG|nr:fatty acid elongase [Thamnocephalis sphaerospora]|eukprot:RKP10638.1 fatty acid elongase [Thamnocephalis sphaerospora]
MANASAAQEAVIAAAEPLFSLSLDRPFGFNLDAGFAYAYQLLFGQHPDQFRFVQGKTWLSTNMAVTATCLIYLAVIFGGQALMRNRAPIAFPILSKVHNLILSVGSGVLLLLFIEQLLGPILRKGPFWAVCADEAWTQRLELLYYINYLFKYYELVDTVFLMLKKKPLEFLHYYHHSLTMALCYTQLVGRTSVSWVPIVLNLGVHVVMYYYYFLASCGVRVWWKKYLTTMQITQFVLDLTVIYFCTYTYFAATYAPSLPNMGTCAGTETAALWGALLLSSYLVLFIKFYRDTYIKQQRGRAAVKAKKSE